MTKRHFVAPARILRDYRPEAKYAGPPGSGHTPEWETWDNIRSAIIVLCKRENPAFDNGRFRDATEASPSAGR